MEEFQGKNAADQKEHKRFPVTKKHLIGLLDFWKSILWTDETKVGFLKT